MLEESLKQKVLRLILYALFALLFLRLFQLQVIEGAKYRQLAERNAARIIPEFAPRGVIYDRYQKPLVTNKVIFGAYILPHLLEEKSKAETIQKISRLTGVPVPEIEAALAAKASRPFEPLLIKDHLPLKMVTYIEEQKENLAALTVRSRPVRHYLYGPLAVHVLGYVGEIDAALLAADREEVYKAGDYIGKLGVEKVYDRYLRGVDGGKKLEIDVRGRPVRVVETVDPLPGNNLELTLDLELQQEVEKVLSGHRGAVVVLDPHSGEVLALASSPGYDPDLFSFPLKQKDWERVGKSRLHPFLNRALSVYPSGSIFKPVTLTAVLEEKLASPTEVIYCPGYYLLGEHRAGCWKALGHGRISVLEGLVWSCDVVFYEMGRRAGEKLALYARRFGLGEKSGIDLLQEKAGLVPDAAWKKKALGQPWYAGDSINLGIGQGYLQVTPLQMALLYAGVATGKKVKPFVVREVTDLKGKRLFSSRPNSVPLKVQKKTLELMRKALAAVVDRGTGAAAKVEGLPAAGKTGTAENPGLPHAWFVCYAPVEDPQIALAAFVEHGEHGDQVTARMASSILQWYRDHRLAKKVSSN